MIYKERDQVKKFTCLAVLGIALSWFVSPMLTAAEAADEESSAVAEEGEAAVEEEAEAAPTQLITLGGAFGAGLVLIGAALGIAGALLGQNVQEFDQIRGLTIATNVLCNAFADAPAAVTGSFTVDRGVVVTNDLRVDGRQAVALTQARADLPRWQLDSSTSVYLAEDPNRAYVTISLRGPLDAPNPRLSGTPLQPRQQLAPAPSTGPAPSTSTQTAPQTAPLPAPETLRPEDLLRQGLEQGLKKLFGN